MVLGHPGGETCGSEVSGDGDLRGADAGEHAEKKIPTIEQPDVSARQGRSS